MVLTDRGLGGTAGWNRRQFAQKSALAASYVLSRVERLYAEKLLAGGRFLELLPFQQEGAAPLGTAIAAELDQRRYTDLSRITAARMMTPTNEFFVRSGTSALLPAADQWTISVDGLVAHPARLAIRSLRLAARPMGTHLMECAGNVRIVHFGLISVASWTGVLLSTLLAEAGVQPGGSQVLVSGFDQYASPSMTSMPGASWIFPVDALTAAGAFLATGMNGERLPQDHGAPVRLVVPGWYGCACIKWVQSITLIDDMVEATSQMREYAARTLQSGIPELGRDFEPPTIDHAALPIRVEKWRVAGKVRYRVMGLLWGGAEPVKTLQIRFNPDEEFVTVQQFHPELDPGAPRSWMLWEHLWSPQKAGMYALQLAVSEPAVRARKMDAGYYVRFVEIGEV